jgi:hypothetical protein
MYGFPRMMVPRVGVTVAILVRVKEMVDIERGVAIIPWTCSVVKDIPCCFILSLFECIDGNVIFAARPLCKSICPVCYISFDGGGTLQLAHHHFCNLDHLLGLGDFDCVNCSGSCAMHLLKGRVCVGTGFHCLVCNGACLLCNSVCQILLGSGTGHR